jgi:WD40 repeat protein
MRARLASTVSQTLRVFDVDSGNPSAVFALPRDKPPLNRKDLDRETLESVAWSPAGDCIATVSRQQYLALWDPSEGCKGIHSIYGGISTFAWSPDGAHILFVTGTGLVMWTARGGEAEFLPGPDRTACVAWSPDGQYIVTYDLGSVPIVGVWHVETGAQLHAMEPAPPGPEASRALAKTHRVDVAWSPDGAYVAATAGHAVRIFHAESGAAIRSLVGHANIVRTVSYSPDGLFIATAGDDQTVRLWRAATGEPAAVLLGHTSPVSFVAWSGDSARLAAAAEDSTTLVWAIAGG